MLPLQTGQSAKLDEERQSHVSHNLPLFSRFAGGNHYSDSVEFCGIYNFERILRKFYQSAISQVLSIEGL